MKRMAPLPHISQHVHASIQHSRTSNRRSRTFNQHIRQPSTLSSKPTIPSRLRCDPIRLAVCHPGHGWRRAACTAGGALSEHEPRTAEDGRAILLLLRAGLTGLTLVVVAAQCLDGRGLLAHEVDEEGHGEVGQAVAPRQLHDHVEPDQVVAGVQHADVALAATDVNELSHGLALRLDCGGTE